MRHIIIIFKIYLKDYLLDNVIFKFFFFFTIKQWSLTACVFIMERDCNALPGGLEKDLMSMA